MGGMQIATKDFNAMGSIQPGNNSIRWLVPSRREQELLEALIPFDDLPENAREIKRSRSRRVLQVRLKDGRSAYLKRYRVKSRPRQAASLFHPSKARREYTVCREARRRGLPVAAAVGAAEVRRHGFLLESYIAHEAVEPAVPLQELLRSPQADLGPLSRKALLKALAGFVASIQQSGIEHDDLQSSHILVRLPIQPSPQFTLIDMDGARLHPGPLDRREVIRHLAQLNRSLWGKAPTPRERLQFLRELIKVHPQLKGVRAKPLWERIALLSALRWGRKSRVEQEFYAWKFIFSGRFPPHLRQILKGG